jgi:hypothetical protein
MTRSIRTLACSLVLLLAAVTLPGVTREAVSGAGDRTTYLMRAGVLGAAGAPGASGAVIMNGTLGQPQPIGAGISGDVSHVAGFWATLLGGAPSAIVPVPVAWANDLRQNFPNPFSPMTAIAFSSAQQGNVSLIVYDVCGATVRTLAEEEMNPGLHRVIWDGTDDRGQRVAAGLYFCRLRTGAFHAVKRMVLVK